MKRPFCSGKSYFDFIVSGQITTNIKSSNDILILNTPTFKNLQRLKYFKACIFTDLLAPYSHEVILLNDMRIPYIHDMGSEIYNYKSQLVTLYSVNNNAHIYLGINAFKLQKSKIKKKQFGLTSTIAGMKYHLSLNTEAIATRGEFILLQMLNKPPLEYLDVSKEKQKIVSQIENCISFAANNFDSVIYRFTDFSRDNMVHLLRRRSKVNQKEDNILFESRGTFKLIYEHKELFLLEINTLKVLSYKYKNICLLLPFVRSVEEAKEAISVIKKQMGNRDISIGVMIEVPILLFRGKELANLCDFFVVGTKDLSQLLFATDRKLIDFNNNNLELISKLLMDYFLGDVNEKKVFITSEDIFDFVRRKGLNRNIFLLSE